MSHRSTLLRPALFSDRHSFLTGTLFCPSLSLKARLRLTRYNPLKAWDRCASPFKATGALKHDLKPIASIKNRKALH
jgi:hypothetical protein